MLIIYIFFITRSDVIWTLQNSKRSTSSFLSKSKIHPSIYLYISIFSSLSSSRGTIRNEKRKKGVINRFVENVQDLLHKQASTIRLIARSGVSHDESWIPIGNRYAPLCDTILLLTSYRCEMFIGIIEKPMAIFLRSTICGTKYHDEGGQTKFRSFDSSILFSQGFDRFPWITGFKNIGSH